uniref:30S ribosomal protein S1 n=1 Tax=Calliarthron tuberculosum TaxID=48942 RepID=M4IV58_CALTB|nr:30S ribosomal protein S1 [Calliarthron tuberculosum]AGA63787.1 30S ribosomal protein S1 [Calliarthron tuberculosum]
MHNQYGFTHSHKDFALVLKKYKYNLNLADITAGTIFSEEKEGFLVDIGAEIAAYLPKDEISINPYNLSTLNINDTREFFILAYNKKSEQLIISIKRLEYIRAWKRIKQMKQEDMILKLYIHRINKGGLLTTIEGIKAFIPNSHLTNKQNRSSLIHVKILCKFLVVDEKNNNIIFSNRRAKLDKLNKILYIGQITNGKITKITNYGIFIEVHGFSGLLHISEISNENINNLHIFNIGDIITIKIIHIDQQQGRLSVSRRNLNID